MIKDDEDQINPAEEYLRNKYGAYRGHPAWRELEKAFKAGMIHERDECGLLFMGTTSDPCLDILDKILARNQNDQ